MLMNFENFQYFFSKKTDYINEFQRKKNVI